MKPESLSRVQNAFSRLLSLLLNGQHLSNASRIFYPIIRSVHRDLEQEILVLKNILGTMCSSRVVGSSLENLLAESIQAYDAETQKVVIGGAENELSVLRVFDYALYDSRKYQSVRRLVKYIKEHMEPFLIDAYIHGSISTLDDTAYSDLDVLFLIRLESLQSVKQIRQLEKLTIACTRFLYEFDPLQHHGLFFLTEPDLRFYNQSYLPLAALELSTSILGKGCRLTVCVRDSGPEGAKRLLESAGIVCRYAKNPSRLRNVYYLKGFLSHVMMLPVLFLQAQGEYIDKKSSFEILKNKLPKLPWSAIDRASAIRAEWSQAPSHLARLAIHLVEKTNFMLIPHVSQHVLPIPPTGRELVTKQWLEEIDLFARTLLNIGGHHAHGTAD